MRRRLLFENTEEIIPTYEIIDYDPDNRYEDKDHELNIRRVSPDTFDKIVFLNVSITEGDTLKNSFVLQDTGGPNFYGGFIVHPSYTEDLKINITNNEGVSLILDEYTFTVNKRKNYLNIQFDNTGIGSVYISGSTLSSPTWIYSSTNIAAYDGDTITWTAYSKDSHCWYGNNNTTSISGTFIVNGNTLNIPSPNWKLFDVYVSIPIGIDSVYISGSNANGYSGGFWVYWSGWTTNCVEHTDQITWTAYPSDGYRTVNGSGTERVTGDVYIYPTVEKEEQLNVVSLSYYFVEDTLSKDSPYYEEWGGGIYWHYVTVNVITVGDDPNFSINLRFNRNTGGGADYTVSGNANNGVISARVGSYYLYNAPGLTWTCSVRSTNNCIVI